MSEELENNGYSKEEDYFYRVNQSLIEERRQKLDEERRLAELDKVSEPYWMRCPKCGVTMQEINLSGIVVEQCGGCNGLFFDSGELETLFEARERKNFLHSLKRVFDN